MLNLVAYLDPGTNSFLLQMLLGGTAGLMMLVRAGWDSLRHSRKAR
jgi:hypothetical protein